MTQQVTVAPLIDKRLQFWQITGIEFRSTINTRWKTDPSANSPWSPSQSFQTPSTNTVYMTAAPQSDGRLQLWAIADGKLFTSWKINPASTAEWTAWQSFEMPPGNVKQIAAAPLSDGRLQLWAITADGKLFTSWKTTRAADSPWSPSQSFETPSTNTVYMTAAPLSDGRLQLWAIADGKLFTRWKTDPSADSPWSPWQSFEAPPPTTDGRASDVTQIAAAPLSDGRLQLWVVSHGEVSTRYQNEPSSSSIGAEAEWTKWNKF
jgi:hypothetical protein